MRTAKAIRNPLDLVIGYTYIRKNHRGVSDPFVLLDIIGGELLLGERVESFFSPTGYRRHIVSMEYLGLVKGYAGEYSDNFWVESAPCNLRKPEKRQKAKDDIAFYKKHPYR